MPIDASAQAVTHEPGLAFAQKMMNQARRQRLVRAVIETAHELVALMPLRIWDVCISYYNVAEDELAIVSPAAGAGKEEETDTRVSHGRWSVFQAAQPYYS